MPTITVQKSDLYALAGLKQSVGLAELDERLALVKGELGPRTRDGLLLQQIDGSWLEDDVDHNLRIELKDTNRPDLWSVEGIARHLRDHARGHGASYDIFTCEPQPVGIEVDARLETPRPFIGGFLVQGHWIDEAGLLAFIEAQETLTRNFGRRRKTVSIGLYDATDLQFPVQYKLVGRDGIRFAPLPPTTEMAAGATWQSGTTMTPAEILAHHPTGQAYGWILDEYADVPMLLAANGEVLSFPPIINSAGLGRVTPGATALFVEATGTDLDQVLLTLNILATNLVDRGWTIVPVTTHYPYDTPRGRTVTTPHPIAIRQPVSLDYFTQLLGEPVELDEVVATLRRYGITVTASAQQITATGPDYRQDYLHAVDVIEDFAISRGYQTFAPAMPTDFTIGKVQPLTNFEDQIRDLMIGFGFEEGTCNILTNVDTIRGRMALPTTADDTAQAASYPFHGGELVRITNVMNRNYGGLRDWILPSLMEVESHSTVALYPHRIFEVGEVAVYDPIQNLGSRTESRLAAIIASEDVSFDAIQSVVYALLGSLGISFAIAPWAHASFIPGRVAHVVRDDEQPLGFLGELAPQVLTNWGIRVPVVALELSVNGLYAADG